MDKKNCLENTGFLPERLRKAEFWAKGFTMVELVVSIFLIAIVLGAVLLLMAANLNVLDKANEIMVANAIVQYAAEDVRNADFPPVYYDRQTSFGDRPIDVSQTPEVYKGPEGIDSSDHAAAGDWTPDGFQDKYLVRRYDFRYDGAGEFLDDTAVPDTDIAMKHRVDIYVLKKSDSSLILKGSAVVSRDGLF